MMPSLSVFIISYIFIQTNQMGCSGSFGERQQIITVATLNYSGILLSPYEFYQSGGPEQKRLNSLMKDVFDQQKIKQQQQRPVQSKYSDKKLYLEDLQKFEDNRFKFEFGPFEKQWQQQRFSPLYLANCGVKNNVYMMGRIEFIKEWQLRKEKNIQKLTEIYKKWKQKKLKQQEEQRKKAQSKQGKQDGKKEAKKQEKIYDQQIYLNNLMKLDLYIYKAILKDIYPGERKANKFDNANQNNKEKEDDDQKQYDYQYDQNKQITHHFDNQGGFQLPAKQYRQIRKKKFMKSFLDEDKKIQITIDTLSERNIDIFFLQEASDKFLLTVQKKLNNFRIVKSDKCQSVILIRQSKFPNMKSLMQQNSRLTSNILRQTSLHSKEYILSQQQLQSLNFNKDTVIQCIYNLIFVCPHLVSKKQSNPKQMKDMKQKLAFLKSKFPECHIILGGDLNGQIQNFKRKYADDPKQYKFNVVPDYTKHFTAFKKRTRLQAQNNKADTIILETKDYIISDLDIVQTKIITVDGRQIINVQPNYNPDKYKSLQEQQEQQKIMQIKQRERKEKQQKLGKQQKGEIANNEQRAKKAKAKDSKLVLLPCDKHPYDHYLLIAKIKVPAQLEHVTDPYYLYQYKPNDLKEEHIDELMKKIEKKKQQHQSDRRNTEPA